ncbi:MAG: hypothetical protein QGI20_09565 [Verrucomicrobiota bacterium]|nr:hypothetical protein [Verrucomicrobiota bacterium]
MKVNQSIALVFAFVLSVCTHAQDSGNPTTIDTDKDGLYDNLEVNTHKTDPNVADTDGDGLGDGEEIYDYNTNPLLKDSDGDGLLDGDEVKIHQTNPLAADSDLDGLADKEELNEYNTGVLVKDSDKDGLLDGIEVNTHKTDPNVGDTDEDGLGDGEEIYDYNTNPLLKDSDGDGLLDGQEVNEHKTSALEPDTDRDGLTDGEELERHKTDPNEGDSDGDGLGDGVEVGEHGTNPLLGDTDRDGSPDLIEVEAGTNPNNPFEYPATRHNPDIGDMPAITVPPNNEEVILGGTVLFKVEARNGTLSYRWIKLGEGVTGANQNVLRIDNVGHDDIGFYVVLVSNKFGTIYSRTVRLDLITELGKPRLDIVVIDGNRMTIEVTGDSLHTYEIQHSRDLKEWRPLAYNPLKTNDRGKTRLELNLSPESMHVFFRLTE